MGSDRYSVCPRCLAVHKARIVQEETRVAALYGAVPVEEFDAARVALADLKAEGVSPSFREDWEIGSPETDGILDFIYGGSCVYCSLSFKVQEHYPVWTPEA